MNGWVCDVMVRCTLATTLRCGGGAHIAVTFLDSRYLCKAPLSFQSIVWEID